MSWGVAQRQGRMATRRTCRRRHTTRNPLHSLFQKGRSVVHRLRKGFHTGEYELTSRCTQLLDRDWPPTGCARSRSPIGAQLLVDVLFSSSSISTPAGAIIASPPPQRSLGLLVIERISTPLRHHNPHTRLPQPPLCPHLPHTFLAP